MDDRNSQLGALIIQERKPIALYSLKLKDPQMKYTLTENELLSIVETLTDFGMILLGQQLKIYTDHKNMACK